MSDDTVVVAPGAPVTAWTGDVPAKLERFAQTTMQRAGRTISAPSTPNWNGGLLPLGAIYLLETVNASSHMPAAERFAVSRINATLTIALNLKPSLRRSPRGIPGRLRSVLAIVSEAPVYKLHVIRSFDRLPEAATQILAWHH
jgi:hypothetical protein